MIPVWYTALVAALFGAVVASFLGVVLERVPRGESINGRSRCVCGRQLRGRENIPVLGWVLSGGRARCCDARIPGWYVLTELLYGAAWAGAFIVGGPVGPLVVAVSIAAPVLLAVARRARR